MSKLAWSSPSDLLGGLVPAVAGGTFRSGEHPHPHYQLIALSEGMAWIRDIRSGTDHVLPKARSQAS